MACLVDPQGNPIPSTTVLVQPRDTKAEIIDAVWYSEGFMQAAYILGNAWAIDHWKEGPESIQSALQHGFTFMKGPYTPKDQILALPKPKKGKDTPKPSNPRKPKGKAG